MSEKEQLSDEEEKPSVGQRPVGGPRPRTTVPVGVWAIVESVRFRDAIRVGTDPERTFFHTKDFIILLLTNRTIKIRSRGSSLQKHCYVPYENTLYYTLEKDAAFEDRFPKASHTGLTGDSET